MTPAELPTPLEILRHPELTALAARSYTLELSLRSLVAAYPELDGAERAAQKPSSECVRMAERLILHGRAEARLLRRYRETLSADPPPEPPGVEPVF